MRERKKQKALMLYPSVIYMAEQQAKENGCSFSEWIAKLIKKEEKDGKNV